MSVKDATVRQEPRMPSRKGEDEFYELSWARIRHVDFTAGRQTGISATRKQSRRCIHAGLLSFERNSIIAAASNAVSSPSITAGHRAER